MDDPYSTWAFLAYGAFVVSAWLFARMERLLAVRPQAALERLLEQTRPWGVHFLGHTATKRRVALALGIGRLVASLAIIAVVFLEAGRWGALGLLPTAAAYLIAGFLGLMPLAAFHFIVPGLKTAEDIGPRKVRFAAPLIFLWTIICWPLIWPLDRFLVYLAHQPENKEAREEALIALVENDEADGILEADKRDMISSIMYIGERTVREVMVPRVDVVAIERTKSLGELLALFAETQHSRIPVYSERLDHIVGIVHAKDALRAIVSGEPYDVDASTADKFVRESSVLFVPMTKKLDDLLRELRREKKHMAIVVDEYGGTAGLITMEDILEEIVGEIQDEYDEEEELPYTWINECQVEVDASMDIADLNELLGGSLPDEEGYETLGGFLYHQFSAIPEPGAQTEYGPFTFIVKSVDAQRISKVLIVIRGEKGTPKAEAATGQ